MKNLERQIRNDFKKAGIITVNSTNYLELTNYQYELTESEIDYFYNLNKMFPFEPHNSEDQNERFFILDYFDNFKFEDDMNTRQACIQPKYDLLNVNSIAGCISCLHILIRNGKIQLLVYQRSQNFNNNFLYDICTFCLIVNKLKQKYKLNIDKISVTVGSLHNII